MEQTTLEERLVISYQIKYMLTVFPPNELKTGQHINLYVNIHSIFVHNCQTEPGMMTQPCEPSTWGVEKGGSEVS